MCLRTFEPANARSDAADRAEGVSRRSDAEYRLFLSDFRNVRLSGSGQRPAGYCRYSGMGSQTSARGRKIDVPLQIEQSILLLRGQKVLLDSTLAALYGVKTKVLLQAVKRNRERFPGDFLFQLDKQEVERLRSQIVTSSQGGRRYAPYAFTEQGVAMLSSVLRSPRAVRVNIEIMRAFVRLRAILSANKEFSRKLDELEKQLATHDKAIAALFTAIRELASPPPPPTPKRRIGFLPDE